MKLLHTEVGFGSAAISADFVHRNKWVVNIESCVVETFRHDKAGELLPTLYNEVAIARIDL